MQKVLKELFDQFVKTNGREPNNLEMILIRRKASTQEVNKRKIISMFDRSPVDADKPILGGKNIEETQTDILDRLNKGNKETVKSFEKRNFLTKMKAQYEKSVMEKTENMPGKDHSNYEPLQKSLRDAQDGLTALKIAERKGGSLEDLTKLFDKLRIQNIKKPSSVKLTDDIKFTDDMATGGRAGYDIGGSSQPMGPKFTTNDPKEALKEIIKRFIPIRDNTIPLIGNSQLMFNGLDNVQAGGQSDLFGGELNYGLKKSLTDDKFGLGFEFKKSFADGGRAGYYGGGAAMVGEDLSEIGHGADALMARNMQLAPNSMATTSKGLNYLLGEDNDTIRVPYKNGLEVKVPPSKPYTTEMFKDDSMIFLKGMYGTGKQSNPMFYNEMIKKGNKLREQGVERETIIEIIKNNKDKIDMILKQQTGDIKSFANGGPARQNFKMGRRAFLGLMGSVAGGIAGLKSGLLSFTKGGAKPVAKEIVKEAATGGPPPYFFKLVEKIKTLGDDVTPSYAVKDKENVTKYKDYTLTEDVTTGEQTIQRMKIDDDLKYDASEYYGKPVGEDVYMNYRPGKGQMDETMQGKTPPDEYIEDTSLIRTDKPAKGEIQETFNGVPDDVLKEVEAGSGNVPESFYTGPNPIKKAKGGRIGYAGGKKVVDQAIKKVNNKFGKKVDDIEIPKETLLRDMFKDAFTAPVKQEGKFTKAEYLIQRLENTLKDPNADPYVRKTFPGFIDELKTKPDLAKNENVFKELGGDLPEGQQIVVYGDDSIDFFTTSSGPKNIKKLEKFMAKHDLSKDKALEIMKMEPNDQVMELTKIKFMKRKQTNN